MTPPQKLAPSLVVMIAAGGNHADVVDMARSHGVRAVHLEQLAVPDEQNASRLLLIRLLSDRGVH